MPPGARDYLQVYFQRVRPREIHFDMTLGAPPDGTLGCGEFRGVAQYKNGKWKLFSTGFWRHRRVPDRPWCHYTREQVFDCEERDQSR
jgi:hypothetical protein